MALSEGAAAVAGVSTVGGGCSLLVGSQGVNDE
jgi:hypothetical protein